MPPDQIPQTAQTTAPEDAMTDDQYWASLDADESGGATGTTLADRVGGGLREGAGTHFRARLGTAPAA